MEHLYMVRGVERRGGECLYLVREGKWVMGEGGGQFLFVFSFCRFFV
jgi:hypothetical protein